MVSTPVLCMKGVSSGFVQVHSFHVGFAPYWVCQAESQGAQLSILSASPAYPQELYPHLVILQSFLPFFTAEQNKKGCSHSLMGVTMTKSG